MKTRLRKRFARKESTIGFQIAPMIDVVFVILLFFMVAAGQARVEKAHQMELPGKPTDDVAVISLPDEILVSIDAGGQVFLNDDPLDGPSSVRLDELSGSLIQLKRAAEAAGASLFVTIQADEQARYQRVVDVLEAMTRTKISSVTFQAEAGK